MGNHPYFYFMKIIIQLATLNFILIIGFYACSSTEVTKQKEKESADSIYVFDEVPPEDIYKFESPVQQSIDVYVVQIGAFTSLERAKEFAEQSRAKLNKDIKVEFNQQKNLYVVWIHPPFENKSLADSCRDDLRVFEEFKDAWIMKIESKK
jgi:cell division septation protein DedD